MKILSILSAAMFALVNIPAMSQSSVCLGFNCPDDAPDYSSPMPGNVNGFSDWNTYATWRGLTGGLHILGDVPHKQCLMHCVVHATDAQKACVADSPSGASSLLCDGVYNSVYTNCAIQCSDNPHSPPGVGN